MKKVTKKAKSNRFVAYVSDEEALITTEANEKKMLKLWMFGEEPSDHPETDKCERYISDYDRYICHSNEVAVLKWQYQFLWINILKSTMEG